MTENEFRHLFNETKRVVLASIQKYLPAQHCHLIDDIVQETYISIISAYDKVSFPDDRCRNNYFYTVAKNETFKVLKKIKRNDNTYDVLKENFIESDEYQQKIDNESEEIREKILQLPDKYKDVFLLALKNYSESEIASILKIRRGTVKSRMHRGREMIGYMFKEANDELD